MEAFPALGKLFDRSKCENVVTRKDECKDLDCQCQEDCRLDRGSPYCYRASKNSYAMLDPYWLGGMKKHVKRIDVRYVFLLRNDPLTQAFMKMDPEEAIRNLEIGQSAGTSYEITSMRNQPFYNPHFLFSDSERIELQKRFFRRLFKSAVCYQLNVGVISIEEIQHKILEMIR